MMSFKKITNIAGLLVFAVAATVLCMTAERTGSLWDCGEFILGAYKLQVVHPPGAGLFVLLGRMFTWVATIVSDNPSDIAFSVNIMSAICTALMATFMAWSTMILGKMSLVGRDEEPSAGDNLALAFAGIVGGLASAFCTSIWFSAVEGEVYAMSLMFSAFTIWAAIKWYHIPKAEDDDRWLIFSLFVSGLSVGIHLLSLLTLPAIGLLYYFKKYEKHTFLGAIVSMVAGLAMVGFVMKIIIVGIPTLWQKMELLTVNGLGLPVQSGLIPTTLIVLGLIYFLFKQAQKRQSQMLQNLTLISTLFVITYSTVGLVVVRANADTPVNMNTPSNVMRLIPYLNREQYGERPLLRGPHYMASPVGVDKQERYGLVGDEYKLVDEKFDYTYSDRDKILFPRIGHYDRIELHNAYRDYLMGNSKGKPGMGYNLKFFFHYQFGFMYWRYFMWNFAGRQNFNQGVFTWDKRDGHWLSGIPFVDNARLYDQTNLPDQIKNEPSRNTYFFLPLIFGLLGVFFHYTRRRKEFLAVLALFLITGLGIIFYANPPPQEPRERDYIFAGSFMTFCIWIGLGVLAVYSLLKEKVKMNGVLPAVIAGALALSAPLIMGFQNYDDNDRSEHYASRDYASNFLNSVEKNAIIFTYGDNDTYPLWYAQEVEGIRRDVRVVNLSLIQVDWYINKLRNKVNDSEPLKLTVSEQAYNGKSLNQIFFPAQPNTNPINLDVALKSLNNGTSGQVQWPSSTFVLPIDPAKIQASKIFSLDTLPIQDIVFTAPNNKYLTKDELAIMDVVASNIYDRPIYFSVTCKNDKLLNMNDFMQLEGLGLRVIPVKSQSEKALSIYGSGRVDVAKATDIILNKWKWGNFDKVPTFVDKSYMAETQAMRYTMLRTAYGALAQKDNATAAKIAHKYFEAFPNFNFRYDVASIPFLKLMEQSGDKEGTKKYTKAFTEVMVEDAKFLGSLNSSDLKSFGDNISMTSQGISEAIAITSLIGDEKFSNEIKALIGDKQKVMSELQQLMMQ